MMPARRKDIDIQNVVELYESGTSTDRIAKMFGVSPGTILNRLREAGVKRRRSGPPPKFDRDEICRLYREGVPIAEIKEKTGAKNDAVFYYALRKGGVPVRLKRNILSCPKTQAEVIRLDAEGFTHVAIAKQMRINRNYISKLLSARRCEHSSVGVSVRFSDRFYRLIERVDAAILSSPERLDREIANEHGCLPEFVRKERLFLRLKQLSLKDEGMLWTGVNLKMLNSRT